jgi:hypothetical protein
MALGLGSTSEMSAQKDGQVEKFTFVNQPFFLEIA